MKKRYARILAATLSAAMVFTSAPTAAFATEFDVVTEDVVAEGATNFTTPQAAIDKLNTILNNAAVKWEVDYQSGKGVDDIKSAIITKVTELDTTTDFTSVTLTKVDTTLDESTETPGNYSFNVSATATVAGAPTEINAGLRVITIKKKAAVSSMTDFKPATASFVLGSATIADTTDLYNAISSSMKDSEDQAISATDIATDFNGYTATKDSIDKLNSAKVTDKTVTVVFTKDFTNCDVQEYEGLITDGGKNGYVKKELVISVSGKRPAVSSYPAGTFSGSNLSYEFGADKVEVDSTYKDKIVVTGYVNSDLSKATGKNVRIETVDKYPADEYDWESMLTDLKGVGANSAWADTWDYNKSTGKFTATVTMPAATNKTIDVRSIVWPKALKDGSTEIPYLAKISDLELQETETSKAGYGTFKLVNHSSAHAAGATYATAAIEKYCIVFTPTKVTVTAGDGENKYRGTDIYDAGASTQNFGTGAIEYRNAVTFKCKKQVVEDEDVDITITTDEFDYGVTINGVATAGGTNIAFPTTGTLLGTYTLKDAKSTDVLAPGKNTITYTYTLRDENQYALENGTKTKDVSVTVTIAEPKLEATITPNTTGGVAYETVEAGKSLTAAVTFDNVESNYLVDTDLELSHQWYSKSKGELYGQTGASFTPVDTAIGADTYYCVIKAKVKSSVTDTTKKAMYEKLLGNGTITTKDYKFAVTNMTLGTVTITDQNFGSINYDFDTRVTPAEGYAIKSVTWSVVDTATEKATSLTGIVSSDNHIKVSLPKDLNAGNYKLCATIVTTSAGKTDDTIVAEWAFKVVPIAITDVFDCTKVEVDTKDIVYGTQLKDLKITLPKDAEKFGSYEWANPETVITTSATAYNLLFYPNAVAKKNYSGWASAGYETIAVSNVAATKKAELVFAGQDITVDVNGTLPAATYKLTGLVGNDTVRNLGLDVTVSVDTTKVDLTKAGTYADAVVVTVEANSKKNEKIVLDGYTVKVANGAVVVKAAAPVAPSVKPTPAPAKQATAAAPKAAKAKATVKVGKKYTLKLKYAAGKKSTVKKVKWTSSKKSVATVSSKGKVTAKKAGKATIYARVYFKDGSMKKVKFTVTVK